MTATQRTVIAAALLLSTAGARAQQPATAPTSAPTTAPAPRPAAVILHEMGVDRQRLQAAIGTARNMGDPAKRAALAPAAIPPLKRLIADAREFDAANGRHLASTDEFEVELRAILAALGDRESTDLLAKLAGDPRPAEQVRGQVAQLLARWVQVPGDEAGQNRLADQLATLDAAHPDSAELAYFTGMMAGSAATPAVHGRLRALLDPMTSPAAAALRQRMSATAPAPHP